MGTGMRITTNAMIRKYSTNLNKALGDLDAKINTVASNRNFNKISEDPGAAMKSFKLRSNFARTDVQIENTKDALAKFDEVTSNVLNCSTMARQFIDIDLKGASGPTSSYETRQAFKQEVDELVDSFLQQMNGKYNENFIFGGASTKELPFEKKGNEIYYRGEPVNTIPDTHKYFSEHSYRDIGFGMKEKEGEIVSTSAFDTAVNGLDVFGYGIGDDGLPNNIVCLAQELSNLLGKEEITGADAEKYDKIIDKFPEVLHDMIDNGLAALGTKQAFLENTEDQLTQTSQILNEQISNLDFCDPAEAITNLMWAQYAYNATLKVGNTLLSNSFIDFMS